MSATTLCTRCGTQLPASLRFCDVCGEELFRGPPLAPGPTRRVGKLRVACGFWVEVVRSLSELPPAAVAARAMPLVQEVHPLTSETVEEASGWVWHAAQHPVALRLAAQSVASAVDASKRQELFRRASQIAWQDDGRLSIREQTALRTIASAFGLSVAVQHATLTNRFGPLAVSEYILGVSRHAPVAAILAAYKRRREELENDLLRTDIPHPEQERIRERVGQLEAALAELTQVNR